MIGFTSYNILIFSILLIIHIDYLYNFCVTKLWYLNLQTNERAVINKKVQISEKQTNFFWIFFLNLVLISTKFSLINYYSLFIYFLIFSLTQIFTIILCIVKIYKNELTSLKFINLFLQVIIFVFYCFTVIDNFLTLFFLLEIIAICYYFFLLSSADDKTFKSLNQFKNLLVLYLWNSFLTSIVFVVFLTLLINNYNTLNFYEIALLWKINDTIPVYFFFVSIFLKLGLPFLHFFKIQIYYLLEFKLLFFYSILTTFINILLLLVITTLPFYAQFIQNISMLVIFLIGMLFVMINAFKTWTIFNLFLYSAITTFIVFLVLFL